MSSSNLVEVTYVDEVTYGTSPTPAGAVTLQTVSFTSESLSGTPTTTESAAIRTDRMSGGQVVTGLEVGGALDFELMVGTFFDDFFALGMMNTWAAATAAVTATFTLDGVDPQRGDLAGVGVGAGIEVNDVLVLTDVGGDKYVFSVITVTDADNLVVACKKNQAGVSGDVVRPQYLDIGADIASVTMSKAYKDVVDGAGPGVLSQTYAGAIVSGFSVAANYGQIVTGSFNVSANGYEQETPSYSQQVVTAGGSVTAASTANPLNASIDVPVVATDGAATEFCIESFTINLDNGLTPQNCIGTAAPRRYELGTAAISIDAMLYLSETSYEAFMPAKLTQTPISMLFTMINDDGGYGFFLPAVQLSFADPSVSGANQPVMIEASGVAKVGASGGSALRVYKL